MPSGAKKRKAAKKKKVHNSSTANPHHGENDGGELSSPTSQENQNAQDPSVEVENKEVDSSENKSQEANDDTSNIEIETGTKSKTSNSSSSSSSSSSDDESNEKKEVVEPAPIESLPETESLPVEITDKAEEVEISPIVDSTDETKIEETKESEPAIETLPETEKVEEVEVSPIVERVEPVDSSLQVSKVYDETKDEERQELVVTETPEVVEENIIVSEVALKDDFPTSSVDESVLIGTGAVELSTPLDHAEETGKIEHSDRQAVVASPPIEERKTTSWKNCCGIFELFLGSGR